MPASRLVESKSTLASLLFILSPFRAESKTLLLSDPCRSRSLTRLSASKPRVKSNPLGVRSVSKKKEKKSKKKEKKSKKKPKPLDARSVSKKKEKKSKKKEKKSKKKLRVNSQPSVYFFSAERVFLSAEPLLV